MNSVSIDIKKITIITFGTNPLPWDKIKKHRLLNSGKMKLTEDAFCMGTIISYSLEVKEEAIKMKLDGKS